MYGRQIGLLLNFIISKSEISLLKIPVQGFFLPTWNSDNRLAIIIRQWQLKVVTNSHIKVQELK